MQNHAAEKYLYDQHTVTIFNNYQTKEKLLIINNKAWKPIIIMKCLIILIVCFDYYVLYILLYSK